MLSFLKSLCIFAFPAHWAYCIHDDCNIEDILWDRGKYWQSKLFKNVKDMNNFSDLFSFKRKDCRKQFHFVIFNLSLWLLIASDPRNNCSENFGTFSVMRLRSGCYLRYALDYFFYSVVGWHFLVDIFLWNVRVIFGVVNLRDASVQLPLEGSYF